jgi:hypothetical protein
MTDSLKLRLCLRGKREMESVIGSRRGTRAGDAG